MPRIFVFGDEAGDFNFSRGPGASRSFILTTVALTDCSVGSELLALRRDWAWEGHDLLQAFHATGERQAVRDRVFAVIQRHGLRIDATIFERAKAHPRHHSDTGMYRLAWFFHLHHLIPRNSSANDELLVVAASLGTQKRPAIFHQSIEDSMSRLARQRTCRVQFCPAAVEPCLQVVDYCCWHYSASGHAETNARTCIFEPNWPASITRSQTVACCSAVLLFY